MAKKKHYNVKSLKGYRANITRAMNADENQHDGRVGIDFKVCQSMVEIIDRLISYEEHTDKLMKDICRA